MPTEQSTVTVLLKKNGDIFEDIPDSPAKVAHYDKKTGHLEWESRDFSVLYMRQVQSAIGTTSKGTLESGFVIKSSSLKGEAPDKPVGKVPPRPPMDMSLGDTTPALVDWLIKYYPKDAILRYGIFVDENGEMVRRNVKRKTREVIDDREGRYGLEDDNDGKGQQVGPKKWEKGPIGQRFWLDEYEGEIIARRPTPYMKGKVCLFSPDEVVGKWEYGNEYAALNPIAAEKEGDE